MVRLRLNRKRRLVLLGCVLVVAYAFALVVWVGNPPGQDTVTGLSPIGGRQAQAQGPSTARAGSAAPSTLATGPPSKRLTDLLGQPLPKSALRGNGAGLPWRSVRIVVTSDAVIAGFGYIVAHGKPSRYSAYWQKSPTVVNPTGRSATLVAFAAAQAASTATYITCTLSVDGVVQSTNTSHGPYSLTTCIG